MTSFCDGSLYTWRECMCCTNEWLCYIYAQEVSLIVLFSLSTFVLILPTCSVSERDVETVSLIISQFFLCTFVSFCFIFRCCFCSGGLAQWLSGKESTCNAGDTGDVGSLPGLEGSPGGGNGNPLQYSCLENPMDRGAWRATVHGVAKSWTWLIMHASYLFWTFFFGLKVILILTDILSFFCLVFAWLNFLCLLFSGKDRES